MGMTPRDGLTFYGGAPKPAVRVKNCGKYKQYEFPN